MPAPLSDEPVGDVTQLLIDWNNGDTEALNRLFPLVYEQLRKIARGVAFQQGQVNRTLQSTALVHEAYLCLIDENRVKWENRRHFYAIASREMRRILIDDYRSRKAKKREGNRERIPLTDVNVAAKEPGVDLLVLNQALDELEALDERQAKIVDMHYFGGLTNDEIGEVVGVSIKTVERDLSHAKRWLHQKLK